MTTSPFVFLRRGRIVVSKVLLFSYKKGSLAAAGNAPPTPISSAMARQSATEMRIELRLRICIGAPSFFGARLLVYEYTLRVPKADLQPIEIESATNEIRITVPKTAPVERFYRRRRAARLIAIAVCSIGCAIVGFLRLHDIAWDAMWFLFAGTFGASAIYALFYPRQVEIYMPGTSIICLTDSSMTVTDVECGRTRCFAKGEVSLVKATRCDFTRCSKLVVRGIRYGRHYRAIIAMHDELPPLARIAEILNQSLHPDVARH